MPYSSDLPSSLAPGAWTLTFDDEFDDPNAPLSVLDGGPFTNAFMTWGDYRTLPANLEQELYVDPSFIPNPRYQFFECRCASGVWRNAIRHKPVFLR